MENNESWDLLLSKFRRLGGVANNVCQKEGKNGRGIFSINPNLKSRIFTPSNLFIKKNDIDLKNNQLRIKKDKGYKQEVMEFFNFYQDNFSWGAGGKETTEFFEKGLSLFNPNLKKLINDYALIDLNKRHEGNWNNNLKEQFLKARSFYFFKDQYIAPIWELVNHKVKSLPFIINKQGISTPNYPSLNGEIRHSYCKVSPINCFFCYGFYSEETVVFSFPWSINIESIGIEISCKGMAIDDDSMKIERIGNKIIIEGLPIGDKNHPKLPHHYFEEISSKIGFQIPKDFFFKILNKNISIRKKIINESNSEVNNISKILIKLMLYEISLISSHS